MPTRLYQQINFHLRFPYQHSFHAESSKGLSMEINFVEVDSGPYSREASGEMLSPQNAHCLKVKLESS